MAVSPVESICPSCGRRPITDDETGWCSQCADNHAVERYWQRDRPIVEARRDDWKARTQSPAALRERQRRHRLLTQTKPRGFAHPGSDPLILASECLELLRKVRKATHPRAHENLDEACELVKQLGWGPVSAEDLTEHSGGSTTG